MSYTPPAYNAADFGFSGATYAPRTNFTWDPLARAFVASGFAPVQIGAPASAYWQVLAASGAAAAYFGSPTHGLGLPATSAVNTNFFGSPKAALGGTATGFQSFTSGTPSFKIDWQVTNFGQPRLFPFHVAPGWGSTRLGAPSAAAIKSAATLGQIAAFGTPATRSDRVGAVTGIYSTQFGAAFAPPVTPPNFTQAAQAFGWVQTRLGMPACASWQTGMATGFSATVLPAPTARRVQAASGMTSTLFGAAKAAFTAHAVGFTSTALAAPVTKVRLAASSLHWASAWGTANSVRSHTFLASGFSVTRAGHPTGLLRFNKNAAGFKPTAMGTPAARPRNRAAMTPPALSFGTPLLKRTAQC